MTRLLIMFSFENMCLLFCKDGFGNFSDTNLLNNSGLQYDFELMEYFLSKNIFENTKDVENSFNFILKYINIDDFFENFDDDNEYKEFVCNYRNYFVFLLSRLFIYVCLHNRFGYNDPYCKIFVDFFEFYFNFQRKLKENKVWISIFDNMKITKLLLNKIIHNFQNEITIFLMNSENVNEKIMFRNLLDAFSIFHKINQIHKIVKFTDQRFA